MGFITDKQTLDDLNLLGKYKPNSIFNIYDETKTRGGGQLLEQLFRSPLSSAETINERGTIFSFFMKHPIDFPFHKEVVEQVELYLGESNGGNRLTTGWNVFRQKIMYQIAREQGYEMLRNGVLQVMEFLQNWQTLLTQIDACSAIPEVEKMLKEVREVLSHSYIHKVMENKERFMSSWIRLAEADFVLKTTLGAQMQRMLEVTYWFDVYISVAGIAVKRGFTVAQAHSFAEDTNAIILEEVTHPGVRGAVANSVNLDRCHNVLFLTGANMAGKSTFMKAFSLAVYLGHLGFPVSAKRMEFSVQDGLYTSINVPDNLEKGYSHFYAEVLRVKHIAKEVAQGKNLVVLFDELFKGTNVKDAYDATVAVSGAFGENRNCSYIISTHIMEAGHILREKYDNFKFVYFPTVLEGTMPRYTYQLTEGITNDRHGLRIVKETRIVEILRGGSDREVL